MNTRWRVLCCGLSALAVLYFRGADATVGTDPPGAPAAAEDAQGATVVIVSGHRIERRNLENVVVPQFVQLRGAASMRIEQVGRWRQNVCPEVQGLKGPIAEYVARKIWTLAQSVGAPSRHEPGCRTNIEVLFTADPQAQLQYVLKKEPGLLGYSRGGTSELAGFTHPIQAWYVTRTQSKVTPRTPYNAAPQESHEFKDQPELQNSWITSSTDAASASPSTNVIDSDNTLVKGRAGSRLGADLSSEFANVMILVDSKQVSAYSLETVAEYIAVLALTRTSLDGCNELPSVIDLLSPACGDRERPKHVTDADNAYLKALYSANLEKNLNVELGELRVRMLQEIEPR